MIDTSLTSCGGISHSTVTLFPAQQNKDSPVSDRPQAHTPTPSHHTRCPHMLQHTLRCLVCTHRVGQRGGWCRHAAVPGQGDLLQVVFPVRKFLRVQFLPHLWDVSDFLLTCNKLSNRFKSFWDDTDMQSAKPHRWCFLSKQEQTFGKGAGWLEPQVLLEKRKEECAWGIFLFFDLAAKCIHFL